MTTIYYLKLFEVIVKHDYYTSGLSVDFGFSPTKECKVTLSKYGLIFKETTMGFAVFYEARETGGVKTPVKPMSNDEKFSFAMILNRNNLINFSELPFDNASGERYYFDNLNDNKNSGDLLLVDDPVKKYVDKDDVVETSSNIISYSESNANPSVVARILDKFDTVLLSKAVNNIAGKITCQFDLSFLEPAVYKLQVDGITKKTFYKNIKTLYENPFGVIEIFKNNSVPADYKFADSAGNVSFKQYVIQFHRRSTIWKYYVIKKYKTSAPNLSIQIGANPAITGSPFVLPDGTDSTLFDFLSPSELKEKPVESIKLSSNGTVLVQNLPNPGIENIKPDKNDLSKVYSEVYIYI